ncbi:hypothetical protein L917_09784 [Phytophthora nicotianae]|uniref:Peroxisomal membrane protein PEX16 n=1 Tax=Phytophthora nicotianae TaxID=4792 RepID=W2L2S4_PHYNI|nr:hypothetical protein L917_09784 [Phytophthora nicotianae]
MSDENKTTTVETDVAVDDDSKTTTTVTRTMTTTTRVVPPSAVSKTASLLASYEAWVGSHAGLARNVETTMYVAPQLVPKRLVEPEVATQFGYSLVGLLHLYHDYVLWKKDNKETEPPTNCHKLTRLLRVPLSLISHVQVLAEVVARRVGGDVGKWRLIVWVEIVKSVLRLALLAQRRRAMLLRGGKYKGVESAPRPSAFARFKKTKQPGARTGKTFGKATVSEPEPPAGKSDDEPNKISFEDATIEVADGSREDLLVAGEVCHILRPVVYAVLRRRRPATSWTPVILSLLVELSGLALSAAAVKPVESSKPVIGDKAKEEFAARKVSSSTYNSIREYRPHQVVLLLSEYGRWLCYSTCFATQCLQPSPSLRLERLRTSWITYQAWASCSGSERLPCWTTITSSTSTPQRRRFLLPRSLYKLYLSIAILCLYPKARRKGMCFSPQLLYDNRKLSQKESEITRHGRMHSLLKFRWLQYQDEGIMKSKILLGLVAVTAILMLGYLVNGLPTERGKCICLHVSVAVWAE